MSTLPKAQNQAFFIVAMFWNFPKYYNFSLTFFMLGSLLKPDIIKIHMEKWFVWCYNIKKICLKKETMVIIGILQFFPLSIN